MYLGIDLAAKEENRSGVCRLDSNLVVQTVFEDGVIIELSRKAEVVAIDGPLTDTEKPFRPAERELMEEFGPMLPLNTPGMELLTERARRIKAALPEGCEVIETYPRAVEEVLDINKTKSDFKNEDEFDAYLCALTAKRYSEGKYKRYGDEAGSIVLPLQK